MTIICIGQDKAVKLVVVDEVGDFVADLEPREKLLLDRYLRASMLGFFDIINVYRKRKESRNGLEG